MPTNKDLLDAAAFHRRRVVAALITGTPYAEPVRRFRAVAVGGVICATGIAAAAAAHHLGIGPW